MLIDSFIFNGHVGPYVINKFNNNRNNDNNLWVLCAGTLMRARE